MTKQELIDALEGADMHQYFEKLDPVIKDTIRLCPEIIKEDQIKLASSKIGGRPDLPKNFLWPTENNGKSLSFIAQINLADVANANFNEMLPKTGILYFFYAAEQDAWGFDYSDRDKFKVMYYEGVMNDMLRNSFPDDLTHYSRYGATSIKARHEVSLPDDYQFYDDLANENGDKLYETVHGFESINKMFGYADAIQNEMELECELVTNGLFCGDPSGYNDPRAKQLEPNAKEWLLLLQIDSNEENDMMWGDVGRLYFWIKRSDLENRRFEKAWLILQCS